MVFRCKLREEAIELERSVFVSGHRADFNLPFGQRHLISPYCLVHFLETEGRIG